MIPLSLMFGLLTATQPPCPPSVQPSERYYMVLFGAQSVPFQGRYTHTFATFVKTDNTPAGERPVAIDTVSWMPKSLEIRPLALKPEPGVNLSMEATFRWIATYDGRVSKWGPYEIDADRYARFTERKRELESGQVQYRAIGGFTKDGHVSNCGQSFASSSPIVGKRYLHPTPSPGENGTSELAERYLKVGALMNRGATHEWLLPVIGADQYLSTTRLPGEKVPYLRR